jgi:site-specific recombinase XerD
MEYPKILNEFAEYMRIENKSEITIKNYLSNVSDFLGFINKDNQNVNKSFVRNIKRQDIQEYDKYMYNKKLSPSTRVTKLNALKTFFNWFIAEKASRMTNPLTGVIMPKIPERQRYNLELDEAKDLLKVIKESNKEYKVRDYAIISLFLTTGLRISELVSLNIGDIKDNSARIIGKGNKERIISIPDNTINAIKEYLKIRPDVSYTNALFISKKGNRISTRAIEEMLKGYIIECGLDPQIYTPHKLRHTAATLMYKYGKVDIVTLQEQLGHSNINTTKIYIHSDDTMKKKAVESNPIASII